MPASPEKPLRGSESKEAPRMYIILAQDKGLGAIGERMGKTPLAAPAVSKQSKPYLYCPFFVVSLSGFVCPAGPFIPPTLWATVVAELRSWGLFWEIELTQ